MWNGWIGGRQRRRYERKLEEVTYEFIGQREKQTREERRRRGGRGERRDESVEWDGWERGLMDGKVNAQEFDRQGRERMKNGQENARQSLEGRKRLV